MKRRKISFFPSLSLPAFHNWLSSLWRKATNERLFSSINRLRTFADRYLIASFDFSRHSRHWCGIENRWLACETIESSTELNSSSWSFVVNRLLIDLIDSSHFQCAWWRKCLVYIYIRTGSISFVEWREAKELKTKRTWCYFIISINMLIRHE